MCRMHVSTHILHTYTHSLFAERLELMTFGVEPLLSTTRAIARGHAGMCLSMQFTPNYLQSSLPWHLRTHPLFRINKNTSSFDTKAKPSHCRTISSTMSTYNCNRQKETITLNRQYDVILQWIRKFSSMAKMNNRAIKNGNWSNKQAATRLNYHGSVSEGSKFSALLLGSIRFELWGIPSNT